MISFAQVSKTMDTPKKSSKAIINRAKKGAKRKLVSPRSTKIISKGSMGYNLASPDKMKVSPTIILSKWFSNVISKKSYPKVAFLTTIKANYASFNTQLVVEVMSLRSTQNFNINNHSSKNKILIRSIKVIRFVIKAPCNYIPLTL